MNEFLLLLDAIKEHFLFCLSFIGLLTGIQMLNTSSGNIFLILGIIPRKWYGLPGILFSPFLHGGFTHLLFNSLPMLVLMNVLLNGYLNFFSDYFPNCSIRWPSDVAIWQTGHSCWGQWLGIGLHGVFYFGLVP